MRRAVIVAALLLTCHAASGQWWRHQTQTAVAKTQTAGASNTATPTRTTTPTPIASLTATQTAKTATPAPTVTLVATVAAIPAVPTGLVVVATTPTTADLAWNASSGATGYSVQKWDSSVGVWIAQGQTTQTGWGASGLAPGSTQYFRVAAYNGSGTSAYCAWVSIIMPSGPTVTAVFTRTMTPAPVSTSTPTFSPTVPPTPTLTPTPFDAPTMAVVMPNPDGSMTISWTPITATVPVYYEVSRADSATGPWVVVGESPDSPFIDSGVLTPDTLYYYRVTAFEVSAPSAIAGAQTDAATSPQAGFAHPGILAVIGGGMLAALFLYSKWRKGTR